MSRINYESSIDETDKFCPPHGHNYRLLYHNIFLSEPNTILEIGTASCGFAKFLKDNNLGKHIVGADLKKGVVSYHIHSRLTWEDLFDDFYEGDATSNDFLEWIKGKNYKFDLVIDDASHTVAMQINLLKKCELFMSDSSVYLIEDISSYNNAKEIIKHVPTSLKPYAYIVDLSDAYNRWDDICIIIDTRKI